MDYVISGGMLLLPKFVLAIRAKSSKVPGKLNITSMPWDDSNLVWNMPQPAAATMPPFNSLRLLQYQLPSLLLQVQFAGFGLEDDDRVNISKHARQWSLPCEAPECIQAFFLGILYIAFRLISSQKFPNHDSNQAS
ncbi:Bifunctional purine biosynthesis PurH [Gossypium arboreum]|uniref:Bifunctional purine biosynthesis PurH n=1 Tax=Gossypium arboreum TaxID=29729 RepID=A0A0B0NL61_GOSAR|nr:Bifunctional purine biosynthesis PurH [Gossypium arboreum]